MDNSFVQLTFKCADNELVALKRAKKEPGALTGKSVVVLKPCDVKERGGTVFMPNTIEMAQLKKTEKGQFKTNVQISSKMTEMDIKGILVETFPFLEEKRFYCAGAADNRTRLDFHGERRIWDGRLIKQKIKGNSALYIYTDEGSVEKHELNASKFSELTTLKRSHDQITSPGSETAEHSPMKEGASEAAVEPSKSYSAVGEKHAKRYAASDSRDSSYAAAGTFGQEGLPTEETAIEKSDRPKVEGQSQLQQKLPDSVAGVSSQHGVLLQGSQSNKLTSVQESMNAREMSAVPAHSMRMGPIMVPQVIPGMVTQFVPGLVPQFVSTASDQQSVGKPLIQLANSHVEARHTGLPSVTYSLPPQTVVSRMNDLKISIGTPQLVQKPVYAEKRDQSAQTDGRDLTTRDSHGLSATPRFAQTFDPPDSGIETSDGLGANDDDTSQSYKKVVRDPAVEAGRLGKRGDRLKEAERTRSNIKEGYNLELLSDVALSGPKIKSGVTEKSPVIEICPRSSPLEGGGPFTLIFDEHLPCEVTSGIARFGDHVCVTVTKVNEFNMMGRVPAGRIPGPVAVTIVHTLTGGVLGETTFEYVDEVGNVLELLLRDRKLQARYFHLLAKELEHRPSSPPRPDDTPKPHSSQLTGSKQSVSTDNLRLQKRVFCRLLKKKTCRATDHLDNLGPTVKESGYEADDEASSSSDDESFFHAGCTVKESGYKTDDEATSSSDDESFSYAGNLDGNHNNETKKTNQTDICDLVEEHDSSRKLCASQLTKNKESTLWKDKSDESCHTRDDSFGEELIDIMNFMSLFKTEHVAVKDSIDEISSNLQETETAISPLNSAVLQPSDSTETPNFVSQRRQEDERIKNLQNPEVVYEQLNLSDTNENSLSDKSRRAKCVKERNRMNNSPAEDL